MSSTPSTAVIHAVESGTSTITRRVEIYESDGVTLWNPDPDNDPDFARLVDGSVSVDYTRDERRTLDLTLSNPDNLLRPDANGGLWYDKIIKVFRGVTYPVDQLPPSIAIVEHIDAGAVVYQFRSFLNLLGFTRTDVLLDAVTIDDVSGYDIIVSYSRTSHTTKGQLLADFYNSGGSVITISTGNSSADLPFVTTSSTAGTPITWGITPLTTDNPMAGVFVTESYPSTASGNVITGLDTTAQRVSVYTSGGYTNHVTGIVAANNSGGKWFDLHMPYATGVQTQKLLKAGIMWTVNYTSVAAWEVQMGEFMIDNIADQNFPHQVKITGRDYTKKCLNSKFENAVTFAASTSLLTLIKSVATNAGITKFKLPAMSETLGSETSADRGTDRWSVMKDAANANGYEIFFDYQGYLVCRKYIDPSFGAITATFKTGSDGNLVTYDRSLNDSRLYNHICIYGDPADGDETRLPYFGEAKNTEPSSPTRIERIGDRYYSYASTFMTSDAQAQTLALAWLKIHALESYELSVGAIYYPWLEAGEIVEILDPDRTDTDPTRFLMDTITFPLSLGPMSLTAKRVTYVGDPNAGTDTSDEDQAA